MNDQTPEQKLIAGLEQIVKDWYDHCPKSLTFVSKVIQLFREYKREVDK